MSAPNPLSSTCAEEQEINKNGQNSPTSLVPGNGRDAVMMASSSSGTDLQRFLQEVGTNTREARYWLKHFQRTTNKLFAVIHVQEEVIGSPVLRQSLCSCLAFLHRHQMRMVLVHGPSNPADPNDLQQSMTQRQQVTADCVALCETLEANGAPARPLMPGCQIFNARKKCGQNLMEGVGRPDVDSVAGGVSDGKGECLNIESFARKVKIDVSFQSKKRLVNGGVLLKSELDIVDDDEVGLISATDNGIEDEQISDEQQDTGRWGIDRVDVKLVEWAIGSGYVVIVPSVGETDEGRLVPLAAEEATAHISKHLQPLKVLLVNERGGLLDESNQVVPVVRLPNDLQNMAAQPWYTSEIAAKVRNISDLLSTLSPQSSVVIVSASRLLPELFTHRGSGTFFKITEGIQSYSDLSDVDIDSLVQLIEQGFERKLKDNYIAELSRRLNSLYISEGYTAAAVLTMEKKIPVPYLDKFVVCTSRQGESSGQTLWDMIKKDHPCLFWRSRKDNPINTWYFHRSSGSRTMGKWSVFWYGDVSEALSSQMIDYALKLPGSFSDQPVEPVPGEASTSPVYEAVNKYRAGLMKGPILKQKSTEAC